MNVDVSYYEKNTIRSRLLGRWFQVQNELILFLEWEGYFWKLILKMRVFLTFCVSTFCKIEKF